ncbi:hypothetical protein GJAV_G00256200 [Gymnothorax javanicus]|nr:hypothetical protein GJAV_G00256200 [Gymnothorax javanicus]
MVKILVAHMTNEHGTSSPRHMKEDYAKGIISLFPYLADPRSKLGYEHYYSAQDGSGPTVDRDPLQQDNWLNDERQCQEAVASMKHTADEAVVKEKMKQTLVYRQLIENFDFYLAIQPLQSCWRSGPPTLNQRSSHRVVGSPRPGNCKTSSRMLLPLKLKKVGTVTCRPFCYWYIFWHPQAKGENNQERSQLDKCVIVLWNS